MVDFLFFTVLTIFVFAAAIIIYSSRSHHWKTRALIAEEALDEAQVGEREAKRQIVRIAEAWPDRALVPPPSLSSALLRVPVMQAGLEAAFAELRRIGAADAGLDPLTWSIEAIAVPVEGDVNLVALVRGIVEAVDDARIDLDLDAAAIRAAEALEGGPAAPIEDVLDVLGGRGATIRRLPIRTLGDVARNAKEGADVDRLVQRTRNAGQVQDPDARSAAIESFEEIRRRLRPGDFDQEERNERGQTRRDYFFNPDGDGDL